MMTNIYERILIRNPVLVRELRSRMRGRRAFTIATIYTLLLSLIVMLIIYSTSKWTGGLNPFLGPYQPTYYYGMYGYYTPRPAPVITSWIVGKALFFWIALLQTLLICVLTPGVTASAITSEKQQQTFPLLLLTQIKPMRILMGKLEAAVSFLLLMILCSLPMVGIVFFLGGVSVWDMLGVFLIQLLCILTFGMIGITGSVFFRKSVTANILAYSVIGFFSAGALMLVIFSGILRYSKENTWGLVVAFVITYIFLAPIAYGLYNLGEWWIGKWRRTQSPPHPSDSQKSDISPGVRKFAGYGLVANLLCYFAYQPPWIDMVIHTVNDMESLLLWVNPFVAVYTFIERNQIGYYQGNYSTTIGNYIIYNPWIVILTTYLVLLCFLFFLNRRFITRFAMER